MPKTKSRLCCLVFAGLPLLLLAPQYPSSTSAIRAVELIQPGTVIERSAPKGWSHLVLKSQPSLPEDQRRQVSEMTARLATMVFTTTLVHVEADRASKDRRFRLARIGLG